MGEAMRRVSSWITMTALAVVLAMILGFAVAAASSIH